MTPIFYAAAMAVSGTASLVLGRLFDRLDRTAHSADPGRRRLEFTMDRRLRSTRLGICSAGPGYPATGERGISEARNPIR